MKIAVFHNLPAGGAKRALYEHVRGLAERGHTIDAYVMDTANEAFLPLAPLSRDVYRLPMPQDVNWQSSLENRLLFHPTMRALWKLAGPDRYEGASGLRQSRQDLRLLRSLDQAHGQMARDIDARGYDLVYVHHCARLLSPALLRHLSTPTVYYCQDTLRSAYEWAGPGCEHPDFDRVRDRRTLHKKRGSLIPWHKDLYLVEQERQNLENVRAATSVLANSWYSREAIQRVYGVNSRVCYLGVDSQFFCPDPVVNKEDVVLSVGSLTPNKCHQFVLDSIASIPAQRRPRMRIIGYDPTRRDFGEARLGVLAEKLLKRAGELGVNLEIQQEVTDEVLRDGYRRAKVVAFAPYLEPFGFISLEAMACGTPVAGVAEGGLRETIRDGETGLLTNRDEEEFGGALDRLLTDHVLAKRMGQVGCQVTAEQWTWDRSVDTLEHYFRTTVSADVKGGPVTDGEAKETQPQAAYDHAAAA